MHFSFDVLEDERKREFVFISHETLSITLRIVLLSDPGNQKKKAQTEMLLSKFPAKWAGKKFQLTG
jgi:hypothetical protein